MSVYFVNFVAGIVEKQHCQRFPKGWPMAPAGRGLIALHLNNQTDMNKNRILLLLALFLAVCGTRADNNVYTIYPVPHRQTAGTGTVTFTPQVTIVADSIIDKATLDRARQVLEEAGLSATVAGVAGETGSNLFIGVDGHDGPANAQAAALGLDRSVLSTEGKYDRHILHLYNNKEGAAQCVILGESVDASFCALASLEQMLEGGTKDMASVTIDDYADQQIRGLVEGYYGYPYSVEVKKQLMRFMMRMKMNTYMYGAKSDPYHSANWQDPYPATITEQQERNGLLSQDMVRDIAQTSAATKVNFIWAIHPGNNFVSDASIVTKIMAKYSSMYDLGVRQFAVFVDDVGVPTSDADCQANADHLTALQQAIDDKWNTPGAKAEDQVRPLHFVPQVYTLSWVSEENRKRFYRYLGQTPSKITIYITGWGVWTVPNTSDLRTVNNELGREAAWWWNYPCNDNADGQLYTSDMYYNFVEMPAVGSSSRLPSSLTGGLGIVSNPMQEGMVSRTPLFSVADYAWNNGAFQNEQSWRASFRLTMDTPEKREAYMTVAPYLRYNDPDEMQTAVNNYKNRRTTAFATLADRLQPAVQVMQDLRNSDVEADRLLYADIAPWIGKLASMLQIGSGMAGSVVRRSADADRWASYVSGMPSISLLDTDTAFTAYALEGMGYGVSVSQRQAQASEKNLYPFMDWLRTSSLETNFFGRAASTKATKVASSQALRSRFTLRTDDLSTSLTATSLALQPGEYVGVAFPNAMHPAAVAVADTLLARYEVLVSDNGKRWDRLAAATLADSVLVKYAVVANNGTAAVTLDIPTGGFTITHPTATTIASIAMPASEAGDQTGSAGMANAIDGDPETFFAPRHNQAVGDTYTVTLAEATDVHDVRFYFGTKNDDYLEEGRMEASADGSHWTPLHLKGSTATVGGLRQAESYSTDIKYLDFEGHVAGAKYVRLYVTKIPGRKWLRVYDFQVNRQWYARQFRSAATYADGTNAGELVDKLPYTGVGQGGAIVYRFVDITYPTAVNVFWNPGAWTGSAPSVELTIDGTTWTAAGQLDGAMTTIAVPKGAVAMRISAEEPSLPLPVYEITEEAGTETAPVTGIDGIGVRAGSRDGDEAATATFNLAGQRVGAAYKGIVVSKGKKVLAF